MASRKLARDFWLSRNLFLCRQQLLVWQQVPNKWARRQLVLPNEYLSRREFSVFNEFSKKIEGEIDRNKEFQQSIKEIKKKKEDLKVVKEDLKNRMKQTVEQLYKHVYGVWTEAEVKAKKENILAAKEEVKESFGIGKQDSAGGNATSAGYSTNVKDGSKSAFGEEKQQGQQQQQTESSNIYETLFGKVEGSISPKVSLAFQKLKDAKPADLVKKGYDIVKDELKGTPNRRKRHNCDYSSAAPSANIHKSTRTDIVVVPSQQSQWSKKWEAF